MEHLVFRRSRGQERGSVSDRIAWAGGQINAMTAYDYTLFHVLVCADAIDEGIEVLAQMLGQPPANGSEIATERGIVLEEVRRSNDKPSNRMLQGLMSGAFAHHPYGRPILGTPQSVEQIDAQAIADYQRRWYRRGNLHLVAVGDLAGCDLERRVASAFERVQAGGPMERSRPLEPLPTVMQVSTREGQSQETYFGLGWRRMPEHAADGIALDLLCVLLTGGESFRLHRRLKRDRGLVSSCHASHMAMRDPGIVIISGTAGPTVEPHDSLAAIATEVVQLSRECVPDEEFTRARRVLLSQSIYRRETVQGWAQRIGLHTTMHHDPHHEQRWQQQLDALTPDDLRRAARRLVEPGPASLSLCYGVGHRSRSERALRELMVDACR